MTKTVKYEDIYFTMLQSLVSFLALCPFVVFYLVICSVLVECVLMWQLLGTFSFLLTYPVLVSIWKEDLIFGEFISAWFLMVKILYLQRFCNSDTHFKLIIRADIQHDKIDLKQMLSDWWETLTLMTLLHVSLSLLQLLMVHKLQTPHR